MFTDTCTYEQRKVIGKDKGCRNKPTKHPITHVQTMARASNCITRTHTHKILSCTATLGCHTSVHQIPLPFIKNCGNGLVNKLYDTDLPTNLK